jgi:Sulfotransferase domain
MLRGVHQLCCSPTVRRAGRRRVFMWLPFRRKSRLPPKSVYLYTLHKCGSGLFSNYLLKNINGLRQVDYEYQFFTGEAVDEITFEKRGFVYGPIRLSTGPPLTVYHRVTEPVSRTQFVRNKIAIFVIRDPRDILVSAYYSFGYTHGLSVVEEIREVQEKERTRIQSITIDDYVVATAPAWLHHFGILDRLVRACRRKTVLKYEDMIDNWEKFASGFTRYVEVSPAALQGAYERCRPMEKEDPTAHRRSGKTGAYREKLQTSTIAALNQILAPVLTRFNYQA